MAITSMGRILAGLAMIVFVGALAAGATGAFFSDTETSTGNTFTAGDIDLQIDNESYVVATSSQGSGPSNLVASPATSWAMSDLVADTHRFFDFTDVKPGDVGEDTISIHVGSNNAWMCAAAQITADEDVTCTEPELTDDPTCASPGAGLGELDSSMQFGFWEDDGDNVLEADEVDDIFLQGTLASMGAQGKIALADSAGGINGPNSPIPGDTTFYIGKAWCMGTLAPAAVAQDGLGKVGTPQNVGNVANGPLVRGTGVSCDGSAVNNAAQTDRVVGDMQFYAVQSRNNATFTCAADYDGFEAI